MAEQRLVRVTSTVMSISITAHAPPSTESCLSSLASTEGPAAKRKAAKVEAGKTEHCQGYGPLNCTEVY